MDKLQRRFNEADANHDGNLDRCEFFNLLKSFGVALDADQLTKIFRDADQDGDGSISFTEFKEACVGNEITEITRQRSLTEKRERSKSGNSARNTRLDSIVQANKDTSRKFSAPSQISPGYQDKPPFESFMVEGRLDECSRVLTAKEIREGCKYFWSCDENGDGKLSRQEFSKLLTTLGLALRKRSAERAFEIADTSKDGFVSFIEFFHAYVNKNNSKQVKDMLDRLSKGKNGYITVNQCLKALAMFGCEPDEVKLQKMMNNIGMGADGLVSVERFYTFMGLN